MTPEQHKHEQRERKRERERERRRRGMTPEQHKRKLERTREWHRGQTDEQRERKRERERERRRRATPEQQARRREERRKWYRNLTPEQRLRMWEHKRLKRYGLSRDTYYAILELQNHGCAICGDAMPIPHIDHDHAVNRVRGLLCMPCNTGLGYFADAPGRCRAAALYLENWRWAHRPKEAAK